MRRYLSQLGRSCSGLLSLSRARVAPQPADAAGPRLARSTRVLLAASLLSTLALPLGSGAPETAQAATTGSGSSITIVSRGAESSDGLFHITLIPGASEARYVMTLRTLGQPPKTASCTTRDVSGEIVLTPEGTVVPELSNITVDQRGLKCAAPLRDAQAQQLLQTAQHPIATFVPQQTPGLKLEPGPQSYQMIGNQTVRGVTQTVAYDTSGTSTMDAFSGPSRAVLKMSDFGIQAPQIGPLLQVADEMTAEVDIQAAISAPAGAAAAVPAAEGEAAP